MRCFRYHVQHEHTMFCIWQNQQEKPAPAGLPSWDFNNKWQDISWQQTAPESGMQLPKKTQGLDLFFPLVNDNILGAIKHASCSELTGQSRVWAVWVGYGGAYDNCDLIISLIPKMYLLSVNSISPGKANKTCGNFAEFHIRIGSNNKEEKQTFLANQFCLC